MCLTLAMFEAKFSLKKIVQSKNIDLFAISLKATPNISFLKIDIIQLNMVRV